MSEIYLKYDDIYLVMSEIEICQIYTQDIPEICLIFA